MKTDVIIVAAGRGMRAGEGLPKQYRALQGKCVLRHTVETFLKHEGVRFVQVVINAEHEAMYQEAVKGLQLLAPCYGGETRQISVKNGLSALNAPDFVLIHDAARPFVSQNLITDAIDALSHHEAAVPAMPVTDTIKVVAHSLVENTPSRASLMAVQTPQAFHYKAILDAHEALAHLNLSDDASLFEALGKPVHVFSGDIANIKLTYEKDFVKMIKVAQGYDVHAFKDGDHVMLGGVRVPHNCGILAHSDGDVILHALTDAILGVLGDGDIGTHFPPYDEKWKGAASSQFLAHACELLRKAGGVINHLDVSLVSEAPKISPFREEIRASIAQIAGISLSQVGLKATTSEKMGFTGRREGLAALALVTVEI